MVTRVKKVQTDLLEDKAILMNAVSELKKSLSDHKKERRAEWKVFKVKFNEDLKNIKKTLKMMSPAKKK
jgi:hypothetical protein